jgi:hypothetical protein
MSEWPLASGDEVAKHILGTIGAALVLLIVWRSSQIRTHGVQQVVREPPEDVRATTSTTKLGERTADTTPASDPPSVKPGTCADDFPRTRSRPGSRNSHTPVSWAEPISSASEETAITSAPSPVPSRSVTRGSVFDADFWNAVPTATLDPSTEAMSAEEAAACDELLRLAVASEAMSEEEAEACAESLRTPAFDLPVHCGREQAPPSPLRPTPSPLRPACEGPLLQGFLQAVAEEHDEDHRRDEPFRRSRGEASRGSQRAHGECESPATALGGCSRASLPTLSSLNLQSHLSLEGEMSTAERIARWREPRR